MLKLWNNTEHETDGSQYDLVFCILRPKSVEDVKTIVDKIKENKIIAFTFENVTVEEGQRINDILFGATQITGATIQKISDKVYAIIPDGIDIENV